MKKKVFKSALSVAVAFAVFAVSLLAAIPAVNLNASAATQTDTWDGTMVAPTKTDDSGNILIETAEELAWVALGSTPQETKDKHYKIVDGAVFDLGGMVGITPDSTASDVNDAAKTGKNWYASSKTFAGHFDGNGAVIYNMNSSGGYSGLFSWICVDNSNNTCSFSNVTIKASYIKGYHYAGALVGYGDSSGAGRNLNITNVKVENCYINATDNNAACNRTGALFVGSAGHSKVTVDGCIAMNNVISATDIKGGFVGNSSAYAGDAIFKNSVVIGSSPYTTLQSGSTRVLQNKVTKASCYSGVYTDQDVAAAYDGYIKKVSLDDMKGAAAKTNMTSLDWSKFIAFDGEYPDFRINHNLTTVSNGDSGHSVTCSDCGKAMTESHNLVENMDAMASECACGYSVPITQIKDTWDGSQANGFKSGTGTKDDPYIIATAEQMAYVALSTTLDSKGKYFKVIDNAEFNMNGAMGITPSSTAAEVKAAKKNGAYKWDSDGAKFNGNFDGNGAVIYNIYSSKTGYGGLFPKINTDNTELSVTIKNVAVKASYFAGYHAAAGIVGNATAGTTSQKLNFENCLVENCYMTDEGDGNPACSRTTATIAALVAHNGVTVDNCLAKGNILDSTNIIGGFVGNTSAYSPNAAIKNSISLGTLPYPVQKSGSSTTLQAKVSSAECYSNVYTDMDISGAYSSVTSLTTAEISGTAALENAQLDYEKIWFANEGTPELQIFHNLKGNPDTDDAYAGHIANCADCGIIGVAVSDHNYDKNYTCTVCGFTCDHENADYTIVTDDKVGDCVTAPNTKTECKCGYVNVEYHSEAKGHKLVKVEAAEPTCVKDGNIEYWTCEECKNIFLTDDIMAAMDTAVTAEDVAIKATQQHVAITDSNGNFIYGMDGQKHWMICKYCECEIDKVSHELQEITDSASGHSQKCEICLYEVHDYVDLNDKGKPIQQYDATGHWYNCEDCGKVEYGEHTLETEECLEGVYQWCEDAEGNSCGYEIFNYKLVSDDGAVELTGSENAFTKDVITDIFAVTEGEHKSYAQVKEIFDKAGHLSFVAYEFSPTEEIADGATVTLKTSAGGLYGTNAAIYYVDLENGTLTQLDSEVVEVMNDKGKLDHYDTVATIDKVGIYAVAAGEVIGSEDGNNGNNGNFNGDTSMTSPATKTQTVASAAVLTVLAAAVTVFARKVK